MADENQDIEVQNIQNVQNEARPLSTQSEDIQLLKRHGIMVVIAGFLANFIVFGIGFSFGVFQDFYISEEGPLYGSSPSLVSIIGTLATSVTYMCGIFNGPLSSRFEIRNIMAFGSILLSTGLIIAGSCSKTWQFALTQGIMFAVGSSMAYLPPVVCGPQYFNKNRGIAMGIVFSGTGIGGLALAPFTRFLISAIGWRWTLRTLGLIAFTCTFTSSRLVYPHPNYRAVNIGLINYRIVKTPKFLANISGSLLQAGGYLIPLFYMSSYGQTLGYSGSQGAILIGVNNGVNALSKIIFGYFADRIGRVNMLTICCVLSVATVFGLWLVPLRSTFIAFVILYGVFSGPIIALLPACLVELFGVQNYHSISGLLYFSRGVGNILGSPIAGLFVPTSIVEGSPSAYKTAILYNGALLAANSACFLVLRGILGVEHDWKWKD
jgi:MFS family permease